MHVQNNRSSGFTLVELSIALLITGLIAAIVLVGNNLVENARLQQVASKIAEFETAMNAFKIKYDCLPGDCVNADALGFPANVALNLVDGNGNDFLDNPTEANGFLYHMNMANLIEIVEIFPLVTPGMEISNIRTQLRNIRISTRNTLQDKGIFLTLDDANDWVNQPPPLMPIEAFQIDTKFDDGLPLSGKTQAVFVVTNPAENSPAASDGIAGSESCVITGTNSYNSPAPQPAIGTGLCDMKFNLR